MALIDISIVNVALTDIRASFGTPIDQIGWVSTGYMMANIVVIPMTGWLQRRFGFRRYFSVSVLIFTAASALCGLAWNLPTLVLVRVLGGLAAVSLITFIVHELEHPNPVVDLRVFKNRSYTAGTGLNFLLGLAVFGASYLFSLYCGAVMHYEALEIGHIFLYAGASQIFLMPLIGKMANRVDPRFMLV